MEGIVAYLSVICLLTLRCYVHGDYCLRKGILEETYSMSRVIKSKTEPTIYSCARLCMSYSACTSFKYTEDNGGVCYLRGSSVVPGVIRMHPVPKGLFYSFISKWPPSLAGACANHDCKINEICEVTAMNFSRCVNNTAYKTMFVLMDGQKNWTEAVAECSGRHGNLAVLDTEDKHMTVVEMLPSGGLAGIWLGASLIEGNFTWLNGKSIEFEKWHPNDPDQPMTQKCMAVGHLSGKLFWFSRECESAYPFLCEFVSVV